MGALGFLVRPTLKVGFLLGVILLLPGLPPHGDFEAYNFPPVPVFDGPLDPNSFALNKIEKLFENQLVGAEAIEESPVDPGTFFSTLQGGAVVKFTENGRTMKPVAKFGEKCGGLWDARKCGRPLGARFDPDGQLVVADSYYGLFKVNTETGESTTLVYKDNEVEGKANKIFNSVAPTKNGKIYYTVSSTNFYLDEAMGELLGPPSGRLLVYDVAKNASSVLQERIHFANGIVVSPGEDFLVVAECLQFRLLKHWIRGPKKGTTEIFVEGLPGLPDNLNTGSNGNILVGLVSVRLPGQFNLIEFMYRHPWLRKLALRLLQMIKLPFDLIDTYLNLPIARQIAFHILNFETFNIPPYAIILEVDWEGRIVQSWHSNLPDVNRFSDAKIIDGYMYLGSPYNHYIGRLKLDG